MLEPKRYQRTDKNLERVESVESLVDMFKAERDLHHEGKETVLSDLLTNLQHYARINQIHFDKVLQRAQYHYEVEANDKKGDL